MMTEEEAKGRFLVMMMMRAGGLLIALVGLLLLRGGVLADVAPSILALMGLPKPAEMTGASLLEV